MKVTVIPIIIGAFGKVTEELLKELEDLVIRRQVKTLQTTALLNTGKSLGDLRTLKDYQLTLKK